MVQAAKRLMSPGQPGLPDSHNQEMETRLNDALVTIQQRDIRVRTAATVQAMRSIARHLAGIPGRKSLIWVLSDFPLTYGEAADRRDNYTEELARVTNVMSEAKCRGLPYGSQGRHDFQHIIQRRREHQRG